MPDGDLFANRLNNQLEVYCSWLPDPYAKCVDAFSVKWSQCTCAYLFPPFSLLGSCVQNAARKGKGNRDSTIMDNTAMVHRINENPGPSTAYSSMLEKTSSNTRKGKGSPPSRKQKTCIDILPGVRRQYRDKGFSKDATRVIMASWSPGTKTI